MNRQTFYHIADIIQKCGTWIKVIDTERFIEMYFIKDGLLKPVPIQTLTLQNTESRDGFERTHTWHIYECDLSRALASLCERDPTAKDRADRLELTCADVEYIIWKASNWSIKLRLFNYDY